MIIDFWTTGLNPITLLHKDRNKEFYSQELENLNTSNGVVFFKENKTVLSDNSALSIQINNYNFTKEIVQSIKS